MAFVGYLFSTGGCGSVEERRGRSSNPAASWWNDSFATRCLFAAPRDARCIGCALPRGAGSARHAEESSKPHCIIESGLLGGIWRGTPRIKRLLSPALTDRWTSDHIEPCVLMGDWARTGAERTKKAEKAGKLRISRISYRGVVVVRSIHGARYVRKASDGRGGFEHSR